MLLVLECKSKPKFLGGVCSGTCQNKLGEQNVITQSAWRWVGSVTMVNSRVLFVLLTVFNMQERPSLMLSPNQRSCIHRFGYNL